MLTALLPLLLAAGSERPAAPDIHCTPTSIEVQGQEKQRSLNPIADALDAAQPGSRILLDPGDYPAFTIGFRSHNPANTTTSGGQPGLPVIVEGRVSGVRILGHQGDTIAIDQQVPNGWITFRNLTIVPGRRAGVMFYQRKDGKLHQGYSFEDCHIIGSFDYDTGRGKRTKWGVWGQMLSDFRFVGLREPARIENIADEHAFYLQNVQGDVTIENVHARDLGRTFCQFTARAGEGPAAKGNITIRNCFVQDACISSLDGFKGGSAFTLCGRSGEATFLFEGNTYRAGFRKERLALTTQGKPYGTGAFTAWEERGAGSNGTLVMRGNDFELAPGCGDRPLVSIGGCKQVLIVGENRFVSGGLSPALALDPADSQGRTISTPNGSVYLAPAVEVDGQLTVMNRPATDEERLRLQRLLPEEEGGAEGEGEGEGEAGGAPPGGEPPGEGG